MKNVLVTRPQDQAHEVAQVFENEGFKAFIEPLFSVQKIDVSKSFLDKKIQQISAVIVASANACDAIIDFDLPKTTKIFAVGKKSTLKLSEGGFKNIIFSPDNSASSLRNVIAETHRDKSGLILNFHGSVTNMNFKNELEKFSFKVKNILSYQTTEVESLSAEFLKFSNQNSFDQVLIFSQNSARIFFKLAAKHNLLEYFKNSQLLCLSDKILHDVKNFGFINSATFKESPILKNFYD